MRRRATGRGVLSGHLLKVINARADYEPLAKFSTWLYRIAHHRLIDHYRQYARNGADLFDGGIDPDELPAADSAN
ncbi:MAG: sigma factor, partial [Azonexus sp.]